MNQYMIAFKNEDEEIQLLKNINDKYLDCVALSESTKLDDIMIIDDCELEDVVEKLKEFDLDNLFINVQLIKLSGVLK